MTAREPSAEDVAARQHSGMSANDDTPSAVEVIAEELVNEGGGPGSSLHSWRCEHPDRYGPCDCVPQVADSILGALRAAGFVVATRDEIRAMTPQEQAEPKLAVVDGRTDPCPTPGYAGRHTAVGAGALTSPYRCHGCGAWFTLDDEVQP